MSVIKVTLPPGELPVMGKQVSFRAPCTCTATDAIQIEGVNYTVCDALGRCITGGRGAWENGELISVILDTENNKALIQNAATLTRDEQLSPATAALFGLGAEATPDDVFQAIVAQYTTLQKLEQELERYSYTPSGVVAYDHSDSYSWDEADEWTTMASFSADTGLTYGNCEIAVTLYQIWGWGDEREDMTPECGMSCTLPVGGVGMIKTAPASGGMNLRWIFDGTTVSLQRLSGSQVYMTFSANVFLRR